MGWVTGGLVPLAKFKEAGDGCKAIQLMKVASDDGFAVGTRHNVLAMPVREPRSLVALTPTAAAGGGTRATHIPSSLPAALMNISELLPPVGRPVVTSAQWSLCREGFKRGESIRLRSPERSSFIPCACALSLYLSIGGGPWSRLSLSTSLLALLRKESCFRGRCCPGGRGAGGKVTPPTATPRHSLLFCVVFFSVWRAPFSLCV